MINVFQPSLGAEELEAVSEVFADNWLGHGPRTREFEARFAEHLGVPPEHTIFINAATAGLFLATELLGLGPGDEVVLPSVSFVAAANAVASTGARPVFCDVDPRTLNPTPAHVESALSPRTKAVLLLHYGGLPGEVAAIAELCRSRGVTLVEDAACAVASGDGETRCGTFGDLGVWSFDAMKVLVTGDGGMLYVRDAELARKARRLAYHGLDNKATGFSKAKVSDRWWDLEVREFGRRLIGNDLTAAIGTVQLRRLPGFVARRQEISGLYDRLLAGAEGVVLPPALPEGQHGTYYFYWVQLDAAIRDQVAADLLARDIYTTFRYPPLHKVPAYGAGPRDLPGVEEASATTLLLPLHQGLDDSEVRTVADELRKAVEHRLTAAAH
ncbi:glutamine--scyllo-inositol aminotransferase [Streptomyces phaeoluteigriseus]|jgi:aminotransferase|uniref:Glutamine--scyllo-inositol aminotransferase n=1 Tax=Streptomyces phaeoluteigriseus TaxID=114686 RepID=A0A1V6MN68_9ACTN|nr:DegT/DnrJ/EryC1/StrS family aminotransferase [Streptomyces phaeoluteigriseus]OQD53889.1 glutamine--scyllo-inositol aminotransferase [Streptomyces phaeoluteigriseus]